MARNPLAPFRTAMLGAGDPFTSLHREMNRLFDDFRVPSGAAEGETGSLIEARMNVSETDDAYRITAEIPGVKEDDIDIRLDDDVLTIRGEKKFERTEGSEKENYHFVERSYGSFQRSMRLPTPVDPEQVDATCDDGILTITLPKVDREERTRRIQVQRGQAQIGKSASADQGKKDPSNQKKDDHSGKDEKPDQGGKR